MGQRRISRLKRDYCGAIWGRHIHHSTRLHLQAKCDIHSRRHPDNSYWHRQQRFSHASTWQSPSDKPPTTRRPVRITVNSEPVSGTSPCVPACTNNLESPAYAYVLV